MSNKVELTEVIWQVVASIPYGRVATYGQVARLSGYPSHARFVGATLKNLPNGTTLPWHRVVNAKGEISFAEGSHQYICQRDRLQSEGIVFSKPNRISFKTFGWDL